MPNRRPYPTDVSNEEWAFVAPYLALVRRDAPQRTHDLREVFDALRWIVRAGAPWRMLPHDFPPWEAVYQQTQRWLAAGVFEAMAHDLRGLLRLACGREPEPTAAILDSRTLRSTPESGARGGYDGAKRKKGSKVHAAVDTLGHLLALRVTPADEQDRAQVEELARSVQEATGESVELAYVDRGYAGEEAAEAAQTSGIRLEVVRHPGAKKGFVLLPRGGGWWSAPSRGRRGFADSPRTTRGCPQRWRGCTSSPSSAFSSTGPSPRSCQVRNTL
jgi:transposase